MWTCLILGCEAAHPVSLKATLKYSLIKNELHECFLQNNKHVHFQKVEGKGLRKENPQGGSQKQVTASVYLTVFIKDYIFDYR